MRDYRLLVVLFSHIDSLETIYKWQYSNRVLFIRYDLRLVFVKSNKEALVLYGYDEREKWKQKGFGNLDGLWKIIDGMPMGNLNRHKASDIRYELCGLPRISSTDHCFHDITHRTCCMLGSEARDYADKTGNPIGKASSEAFYNYFGFRPQKNVLTPWCTCIGSQVCSFYSKTFNDGTHIKFIDDRGNIVLSKEEKKLI